MQSILLPDKPKIIKKEANRVEIEIAGCYPGYGMTLGNAIRRVLLSSLPGAAVTAAKIKGVQHEFTALPGVMEDVTIIMLNLKQVRFRMFADGPVRVMLSKKGAGDVTAGDISVTSDLEVANPDLHIATLTSPDAELEMELEVEKGLGYVPVEARRREKVEVGLVALDALYSPIKRVNYEVENMRVGERTDFNRLRLDIETDGTMTCEEAFHQAIGLLVDHFNRLKESRGEESPAIAAAASMSQKTENRSVYAGEKNGATTETSLLAELKLKTRIANALTDAHLKTVGEVAGKTEEELLKLEGLGDKGVKEIKKAIGKLGFTLKDRT